VISLNRLVWSRRAAIGTVVVLALACTSNAPSAAPAQRSTTSGSNAPAEPAVRRMTLAVPAPGSESNTARLNVQGEAWQLRPMYEHLIGVDSTTGRFAPMLATEWSIEPDGRSYRFKLRRGVQFQGGNGEFTAKDVVFSFQDTTKEDAQWSENALLRAVVDRVEAVNDYEVVFHLSKPDVDFESVISEQQAGLRIMSKNHFDAVGEPTLQTAPIAGTGAYAFKERAQGSYIRFERVTFQHWRVTPDFPEFEFRFQSEASSRLAALLSGEVQMTSLPPDVLPEAEARGFKVIRGRVPALRTWLAMNCCFVNFQTGEYPAHPNSPLMDVRVRRALNKAVNRDELNRAFFAGKGEVMHRNPYHPTREGWNPDWVTRFPEQYGYDAAQARALLADAGQPNLRTTLFIKTLPSVASAGDVIEAIAGYWRAIGVDAQLMEIDGGQIAAGQRNLRFDNHFDMRETSASQFVGLAAHNSSVLGNYIGGQHPDVHDLVKRIQIELAPTPRAELYKQAGNVLYDNHLDIPLFWLPAEAVVDPKVVSDYIWPGSISGTWTQPENVKATR